MTVHRRLIAILTLFAFAPLANASWLSDFAAINIDLAKQVQAVTSPPATHQVAAAVVSPQLQPPPTVTVVAEAARAKLVERIDAVRTTAEC
jgi:hypothetical protein